MKFTKKRLCNSLVVSGVFDMRMHQEIFHVLLDWEQSESLLPIVEAPACLRHVANPHLPDAIVHDRSA